MGMPFTQSQTSNVTFVGRRRDSFWIYSVHPSSQREWLRFLSVISCFLLLGVPAKSQTEVGTVPVGFQARAAVVDPTLNKVYVANFFGDTCCQASGTVTVVDGATHISKSIQ